MNDAPPIRRALISVSDKTGVARFAEQLAARGVTIVSTGGTARMLRDAGLRVLSVKDVTGFPEMMDGRVKTLHPSVHGGILARRDSDDHLAALRMHGIEPIDLVCVNLYPFEKTVAREGVTHDEAVEQIDIGGPCLVRAAAKNHDFVTIVTDAAQYERVIEDMDANNGATTFETRAELAAAAFARTAAYDAAIATHLADDCAFPAQRTSSLSRVATLRYGENPHQRAAVYRDAARPPGLVGARQLHGKALSYNNLNDAAAAVRLAADLRRIAPDRAGACVIKHTNPCGAAIGENAASQAIAGDPLAAYGGILAINRTLTLDDARAVAAPDRFFEVIVAPEYEPDALAMLQDRWKNVRLLEADVFDEADDAPVVRTIPGGALVQEADVIATDPTSWTHAAGPAPTPDMIAAASVVWTCARSLTSNAVAIGGVDPASPDGVRLFGAGAGQMDRVASCRLAIDKAGDLAQGAIAAGDAFFPFADGPELLIDAGVMCLVHPGGSKRDEDTFALCQRRGVTCLTTGVRHFRH